MNRDMREVNLKAAELVVPEAKRLGQRSYINLAGNLGRLGSRGVASIRALASQSKAYVAGGNARVPWFQGAEWGSGGAYRQFGPRRSEGRFILPAVEEKTPEIIELYGDEVRDLSRRAFPD